MKAVEKNPYQKAEIPAFFNLFQKFYAYIKKILQRSPFIGYHLIDFFGKSGGGLQEQFNKDLRLAGEVTIYSSSSIACFSGYFRKSDPRNPLLIKESEGCFKDTASCLFSFLSTASCHHYVLL